MNIPYGPLLVNLDPLNTNVRKEYVSLSRLQNLISVRVLNISDNNLIVYIFKNEYVLNILTNEIFDISSYLNQYMKSGCRMTWLVPGYFLLREDLLGTIFRVTFSNERSIIIYSTMNITFSCDTMVNVCRCYPYSYTDVSDILSRIGGSFVLIESNDYFNTKSDVDMIISNEFVYDLPLNTFLVDTELFDSLLEKMDNYVKIFRGHAFRYEYLSHLLSVSGDDSFCKLVFDNFMFEIPGCNTEEVIDLLSSVHDRQSVDIIRELNLPDELCQCVSDFCGKQI